MAAAVGELSAVDRRRAIESSVKPRMHVIDLVDNCGKHKASGVGPERHPEPRRPGSSRRFCLAASARDGPGRAGTGTRVAWTEGLAAGTLRWLAEKGRPVLLDLMTHLFDTPVCSRGTAGEQSTTR